MTAELELYKAITDLLIAVVCIPCIALLRRHADCEIRELWLKVLSLLAVSSVMGFAAHGFRLGDIPLRVFWVFLYAVMFEASRAFILCLLTVYGDGFPTSADRRILLRGELILCPLTGLVRLITGTNTILIYAVYAALAVSLVLIKLPKHKKRISLELVRDAFTLMFLVTAAIICQVFLREQRYFFSVPYNGVILAHILLAAVPLPLYRLARYQI